MSEFMGLPLFIISWFIFFIGFIITNIKLADERKKNGILRKEIQALKEEIVKLGGGVKDGEDITSKEGKESASQNTPLREKQEGIFLKDSLRTNRGVVIAEKTNFKEKWKQAGSEVLQSRETIKKRIVSDINWRSIISLILGVLFIMVSGIIFATTTWKVLPDTVKIIMLTASSFVFFSASAFAGKRLHIITTGKAFYILGSIFLFVSILGVGYFELAGEYFTLFGQGRYFVYLLGALAAEFALVYGIKYMKSKAYLSLVFIVASICFVLLLFAFEPDERGFALGLIVFSIFLAVLRKIFKKFSYLSEEFRLVFSKYVIFQVILSGLYILAMLGSGTFEGILTFAMALPVLLFLIEEEGSEIGVIGFTVLFVLGAYRVWMPKDSIGFLYLTASCLLFYIIVEYIAPLPERGRRIVSLITAAFAIILYLLSCWAAFINFAVRIEMLASIFLIYVYILFKRSRAKYNIANAAVSPVSVSFLHFLFAMLEMDLGYHLFIMVYICFVLVSMKKGSKIFVRDRFSHIFYTAGVIVYAGALYCYYQYMHPLYNIKLITLTALGIFAALLIFYRYVKEYRIFRIYIFFTLLAFIYLFADFLKYLDISADYMLLLFVFLSLMMIWEYKKRVHFYYPILILSAIYGVYYGKLQPTIPSVILSALMFWATAVFILRLRPEGEKESLFNNIAALGFIYGGSFFIAYSYIEEKIWFFTLLFILLLILYFIFIRIDSRAKTFILPVLTVSYLPVILAFYADTYEMLRFIIPLLLLFFTLYFILYKEARHILMSIHTVSMLLLPFMIRVSELDIGTVFWWTIPVLSAVGIWCRLKYKIIYYDEKIGKMRYDIFNILSILSIYMLIFSSCFTGERYFFTLIFTALYCLQYRSVKRFEKSSPAVFGIFIILACWIQPWIDIAEGWRLKIQIVPFAIWLYFLGRIYKKSRNVVLFQITMYILTMLALLAELFWFEDLLSALIFEIICLVIFSYGLYKKSRFIVISAAVFAVIVVIYQTGSFWLSLAWWVYLLAAGIGLIIYAGYNELKKK